MSTFPTLFLRLEGPMQSWGKSGKMVFRESAHAPTKSGVIGMIACAMGIGRDQPDALARLARIRFGVRVDQAGTLMRDYHTVGAGIGNVKAGHSELQWAKGTHIKRTDSTGQVEPIVSVRLYLADASFLAALQSDDEGLLKEIYAALRNPKWPYFLGRKACPPSRPPVEATYEASSSTFSSLESALGAESWQARWFKEGRYSGEREPMKRVLLKTFIESTPDEGYDEIWQDHPESFDHLHRKHRGRAVQITQIEVPQALRKDDGKIDFRDWKVYAPKQGKKGYSTRDALWRNTIRPARLILDNYRCVYSGEPAQEVHHVRYATDITKSMLDSDSGQERIFEHIQNDLRSVSRLVHEAITMIEYFWDMGATRIDPCRADHKPLIKAAIDDILAKRKG